MRYMTLDWQASARTGLLPEPQLARDHLLKSITPSALSHHVKRVMEGDPQGISLDPLQGVVCAFSFTSY